MGLLRGRRHRHLLPAELPGRGAAQGAPERHDIRVFATAAAAQAAGFRACTRCRPDAAPGSPEWDRRSDLVGRAMRLIADGVVDHEGARGLARRLGHTQRHVRRELLAGAGAGPIAQARAQRAEMARVLLETTPLPIAEVALGAGFPNARQLGDTVRRVFCATPLELRAGARPTDRTAGARPSDRTAGTRPSDRTAEARTITLRLPFRDPFDPAGLLEFLARRAVPHIEEVVDGAYRRSLRLPGGAAVLELEPTDGHVRARFMLDDIRDLTVAIHRSRLLLDLDSDPRSVLEALAPDPVIGRLVRAEPGRRLPGHVDAEELALRGVLGQQVSVSGAATLTGRLVEDYGERLEHPVGAVTHLFPSPEVLADADPASLPMPQSRARALLGLAGALASGELVLNPGADRSEARRRLRALPGIGPWTAEYVAMRGLRDPDAFLAGDLGVRRALERLGQDGSPGGAAALAERWRPYRSYALQHLWGSLRSVGRVT